MIGCNVTVLPRFADKPLPKIALASFPGSGNTWTRHLLQQYTGKYLYTYCCYMNTTYYDYFIDKIDKFEICLHFSYFTQETRVKRLY